MDFTTFLWATFGVFVTLATFSFLYKDNPFYKFAEHLVVGVSAGYFVIILWHNSLKPNLFARLADGDWYFFWLNSTQPWYLIPAIIGAMMWTRFSKDYSWVSRYPMALYIGIATGMAIPLEMANRINKQLYATMQLVDIDTTDFWGYLWGNGLLDISNGISNIIVFVGVLTALIYFFFSKAHTGAFGKLAKIGIWTLMIGFGASFGFTVMARISLFIQRIQDVDSWGMLAFNVNNDIPDYHIGYQLVFWALIAFVLGYIIRELIQFKNSKKAKAQT
jgi:hypothetical protein